MKWKVRINHAVIGLPRWHNGKESACQCRRCSRNGFDPWVRKIPWRRKWQPTPVFLPGESHGQWSLPGCHPWGLTELHATEQSHVAAVKMCHSDQLGEGASAVLWAYLHAVPRPCFSRSAPSRWLTKTEVLMQVHSWETWDSCLGWFGLEDTPLAWLNFCWTTLQSKIYLAWSFLLPFLFPCG